MIYVNTIFILFFTFILLKDYSLTKGKFIKAKIFNAIAIAFIIYYFRTSWVWLNWFILKADRMELAFTKDYGIISSSFMKIDYIIHNSLGAVATIAAIGLLSRNALSRKILLNLIPFLILTSTFQFYMGMLVKRIDGLNDYYTLLISFIASTILLGWIYILYKRKFMIEFFDEKTNK